MIERKNLDIVGDTSKHGYEEFDPKETLNMYVALDPQGKKGKALFTRPGLKHHTYIHAYLSTSSPHAETIYGRAAHVFADKVFVAIADKFYYYDSTFNLIYLGDLLTDRGYVGIADNGTQLLVVDGKEGWVFDNSASSFTKVIDPGFFSNPIDVTVLGQRFIVAQANSNDWGISAINDATAWDTLDRAKLTAYADIIVGLNSIKGLLYIFGNRSVEVWYDSGDAFPFRRSNTQTLNYGSASAGSIAVDFEYAIWLARQDTGQLSVVMTSGGEPTKVSTAPIEHEFSIYTNPDDATSFIFKNDIGYIFYVLNFTEDNRSWMYCINTNTWSQLSYKDEDRWLPEAYFYFNDKHYALTYNAFQVLEMSDQYYDDDGVAIKKMRIVGVFSLPDYKNHVIHELSFDVKRGVGTASGNDDNPLLKLEISRDGGITYGNQLSQEMGKIGKRRTEIRFFNLGYSHLSVFRIENYNKVPFVLLGCAVTVGHK